MRHYLLNIIKAVLGLTDERGYVNDPLFDAVEEYIQADKDDDSEEAWEHLKAVYAWYKEQE